MKTTLLIMAAGLGSRYGGDKQVDGIGPHGEMLMQYSIYDAVNAGFDKLVFVIKPAYRALIDKLCENLRGVEVACVYQDFDSIPSFYKVPADRVKPFGTVHAVLSASGVIDEPFAVINADDFYGRDAFEKMHGRLLTLGRGEGAMVAYRLKNTVSLNGSVTRGICIVENGELAGVKETYSIVVDKNGEISDAERGTLDKDALVSMNMWGFHSSAFENMKEEFDAFLRAIPEGDIKAEYALPTMVDTLISDGKLCVHVLDTDAVWFGVTYREDRDYVAGELKKLHEKGVYPEKI